MKEAFGDLWEVECDARVITTNGFVKNNGKAVMGRGCAKEAAERYKNFPVWLGQAINAGGNVVYAFSIVNPKTDEEEYIYTFPVKHNWWEKADLELIEQSCIQLVQFVDDLGDKVVVVPRPGCGNGQLKWEDVRPILEKYFDDRFLVITNE